MKFTLLTQGRAPEIIETVDAVPDTGVLWVDACRSVDTGWHDLIETLTGAPLEPQHVIDGNNATHPSHFESTPRYDVLIFQGLGPDDGSKKIETRTAAFFLFDGLCVTVRATDNVSFPMAHERLADNPPRAPYTPIGQAHYVVDIMVDRYLQIREPLTERLEVVLEALVDPDNPFSDWRQLLNYRRQSRKLESLSTGQLDALDSWRRNTRFDLSDNQTVRLNDLTEHVTRIFNAAQAQQTDIESAVQLHFSAVAHSTNQTVTTLTILSAIFMPLGLIAGIFGMNFDNMPELHWKYSYFVALGGMACIAGGLLIYFRKRGFI